MRLLLMFLLLFFLSVLSVEPYGMKLVAVAMMVYLFESFSALGRAVWDETPWRPDAPVAYQDFQCSRSSRMG